MWWTLVQTSTSKTAQVKKKPSTHFCFNSISIKYFITYIFWQGGWWWWYNIGIGGVYLWWWHWIEGKLKIKGGFTWNYRFSLPLLVWCIALESKIMFNWIEDYVWLWFWLRFIRQNTHLFSQRVSFHFTSSSHKWYHVF